MHPSHPPHTKSRVVNRGDAILPPVVGPCRSLFVPFSLSSFFLCLFLQPIGFVACLYVSSFYFVFLCVSFMFFFLVGLSHIVYFRAVAFSCFLSFPLLIFLSYFPDFFLFPSFSLCHTVSFFLSPFFYPYLRFLILTIIHTYIHNPQKISGKRRDIAWVGSLNSACMPVSVLFCGIDCESQL